jgi:REP element-mobilizing transposase RayT
MGKVLAYHVTFATHGFWLPNDPRGSQSTDVRAENLRPYGEATGSGARRSVAHRRHDVALRRAAKAAMVRPEVVLTGEQALGVAKGFACQTRKSGYAIHACSILPSHAHLVIARHHYAIEQVVRLLRQAATARLLEDGLHPFADQRDEEDRLPSMWAQDFWKAFLFTEEEIVRAIAYVEANPTKEDKPHQRWSFVTPYPDAPVSDASQKRSSADV